MSNWELNDRRDIKVSSIIKNKDDDEVDIAESIEAFMHVLKRLSVKDFVILLLILMMFLMYVLHVNYIDACNAHYQEILRNATLLIF